MENKKHERYLLLAILAITVLTLVISSAALVVSIFRPATRPSFANRPGISLQQRSRRDAMLPPKGNKDQFAMPPHSFGRQENSDPTDLGNVEGDIADSKQNVAFQ